eukprot:gnl/TRDRNA2_/TRDRNA2_38057_c0_seq1.p1 gnl/TRDRNA2_/TRDRNA2_38057_c0~~gnl/TRDRNA2_/TRDRNA2_38057_c0_seq1.p1  ORF type:complete len:1214 (+),score=207.16 gnl/TRDRNA2_/TRDRNA2_38057_c0_seq1:105-3746(+)
MAQPHSELMALPELDGMLVEVIATGVNGRVEGFGPQGSPMVHTFDGKFIEVPHDQLREMKVPPLEEGGFDMCWPHDDEPLQNFQLNLVDLVSERGYCIVQTFSDAGTEAMEAADEIEEWQRVRPELEAAKLGDDNVTKVAYLEADFPDLEPTTAMQGLDRHLTQVALLLEPVTEDMLDFKFFGRTIGMVRTYMTEGEEKDLEVDPLEEEDIEDGEVERHLQFLRRRKICMLLSVENEGGELVLKPQEGYGMDETRIPLGKNKLFIFRHDWMGYSYQPQGLSLALQSWILSPAIDTSQITFNKSLLELDHDELDLSGPGGSQPPQQARAVGVAAIQQRNGGGSQSWEKFWNMAMTCTDAQLDCPIARFDPGVYYDPTSAGGGGTTYTKHGAFFELDEILTFDNAFFGICADEAMVMAPSQRVLCETVVDCLFRGGYTMESANGENIGIYKGDNCGCMDWMQQVSDLKRTGQWADRYDWMAISYSSSIQAARMAYVLGLKGATRSCDTACSASLAAMSCAFGDMRLAEPGVGMERAFVGGVGTLVHVIAYIGFCAQGMLSHKGRSFTFDAGSDGYARGEGSGSALLQISGDKGFKQQCIATVVGCICNSDGKSATLTAPNGPAQQEIIRYNMLCGGISVDHVNVAECHGTGTALGDPIEVGALLTVLGRRELPIGLVSTKSHVGHTEAAAGISGFAKVCHMLRFATTPNVHLRELNPHLDTNGFPVQFNSELLTSGYAAGNVGVSSFGVGGTNARADVWGKSIGGAKSIKKLAKDVVEYYTVQCPRCLGSMCWLCGVAVPKCVERGKHYCSLIRGEFADYDYCSSCYAGDFEYGLPLEDTRKRGADTKVYIVGSWDAYSQMWPMDRTSPSEFECAVKLGESRCEQFNFVLNRDRSRTIYPVLQKSNANSHIEGPDDGSNERRWQINGRDTETPAGTIFKIKFVWEECSKKISWQQDDESVDCTLIDSQEHSYYLSGPWNQFNLQEMNSRADGSGTHVSHLWMPSSGLTEFQIVRDRDWSQVIYPRAIDGDHETVAGPDEHGDGKYFSRQGLGREKVSVELTVLDGAITVSAATLADAITWTGSCEPRQYFLTGPINCWTYTRMMPDMLTPGVFRSRFSSCHGLEFQIQIDKDSNLTMYPEVHGSSMGSGFLRGPDGNGRRNCWLLDRYDLNPTTFEIVLNLNEKDRRHMVTWEVVESPTDEPKALEGGDEVAGKT